MSTFGWCQTGHHRACRATISGLVCGCGCHRESPVKQGETGKVGAQVKTAPNAEFAPLAGACDQQSSMEGSASRG